MLPGAQRPSPDRRRTPHVARTTTTGRHGAPTSCCDCHEAPVRGRASGRSGPGPDNREQRRTVHHRQHTPSSPHDNHFVRNSPHFDAAEPPVTGALALGVPGGVGNLRSRKPRRTSEEMSVDQEGPAPRGGARGAWPSRPGPSTSARNRSGHRARWRCRSTRRRSSSRTTSSRTGMVLLRTANPTRSALERCIASLEGAGHGFCFGSGSRPRTPSCGCCARATTWWCPGTSTAAPTGCCTGCGGRRPVVHARRPDRPGGPRRRLAEETQMVWVESPTNPGSRSSTSPPWRRGPGTRRGRWSTTHWPPPTSSSRFPGRRHRRPLDDEIPRRPLRRDRRLRRVPRRTGWPSGWSCSRRRPAPVPGPWTPS